MQRFTDLRVWQRCHRFALGVYQLTAQLPGDERFGLSVQLRRATISAPANIAEGSKRPHPRDYAHFLDIARGSLAEVQCLLLVCRDLHLLPADRVENLVGDADDISRMLNALRRAILRDKSPN